MKKLALVLLAIVPALPAPKQKTDQNIDQKVERKVDPTWLYRSVPTLREQHTDLTSPSCHYRPIFGDGDSDSRALKSVTRFGELNVDAHGSCESIEYPRQEELYFVLSGNGVLHHGEEIRPLSKNDFTYVAPTVRHSISNSAGQPFQLLLTTVRIPPHISISTPLAKPTVANLDQLKEQVVEGHPTSVLYKLLIGPHTRTRDRINATYAVADFFLMDFAPGGTNFPHHHETAEEIYLVLDGDGKMAAGGGLEGVEGLHPAKAGDAYYFRPNCTVGFYNQNVSGARAHILAVRAFVPLPKTPD
jgi:mannose-6-phosphate isomerase-like protein (cupin superfamily)